MTHFSRCSHSATVVAAPASGDLHQVRREMWEMRKKTFQFQLQFSLPCSISFMSRCWIFLVGCVLFFSFFLFSLPSTQMGWAKHTKKKTEKRKYSDLWPNIYSLRIVGMSIHDQFLAMRRFQWIFLVYQLPVIDFDRVRTLCSALAELKLAQAELSRALRRTISTATRAAVVVRRRRCWWGKIWREWPGSCGRRHYGFLPTRFMAVISAVMVVRCRWITTFNKLVVSNLIGGRHVARRIVLAGRRSDGAVTVLSCLIEFQLHKCHGEYRGPSSTRLQHRSFTRELFRHHTYGDSSREKFERNHLERSEEVKFFFVIFFSVFFSCSSFIVRILLPSVLSVSSNFTSHYWTLICTERERGAELGQNIYNQKQISF